jgi:HD-GYP domain-containing protein (c-di-GMP phosphodiesterase class II)
MIPISLLRVGAVLASPICDNQNIKLLSARHPITPELLDKLRRRGVQSVAIDVHDLVRLTAFQSQGTSNQALPARQNIRAAAENRISKQLDALSDIELDLNSCIKGAPYSHEIGSRAPEPYDPSLMNQFLDFHQKAIDHVEGLLSNLATGETADLRQLETISDQALENARQDLDLFVCLGVTPGGETYPGRHSMHTAMLAMAIGVTLGLDRRTLVEVGLGCLIHDVGMLKINGQSFKNRRVVGPDEFVEITKHPVRTFDVLEEYMDQVPAGSRMVAYQIHERSDGSGYPRGRTGPQIHPLARIASVADAFTALVARRPYRAAMLPYHAMVRMLQDAAAGLYDTQVVRALLHTIGLFPLGSCVILSDHRVGKVIRGNGTVYDRPVLEVWRRSDLEARPAIVNLASEPDIKVVRAVARLM